jgi:hypothetical protein
VGSWAQVENKTPEEVVEYARAFWERYEEIANFEAIIGALAHFSGSLTLTTCSSD